jgi:hypothetical protein
MCSGPILVGRAGSGSDAPAGCGGEPPDAAAARLGVWPEWYANREQSVGEHLRRLKTREWKNMLAIAALIVSVLSLLITSVFNTKTYKKNRRLEFQRRRDHLSQKISDLNDRQNELHMISARYALVVVKDTGLPLEGERAERNKALIARIEKQREFVEELIKLWDENIKKLHFIHSMLTSEADAPVIERTIIPRVCRR